MQWLSYQLSHTYFANLASPIMTLWNETFKENGEDVKQEDQEQQFKIDKYEFKSNACN